MPLSTGHQSLPSTRGGILARNTIWNLVGYGAPLLIAIFSIPVIVRLLGTDRFGVLNIAWMLIGYFTLFDLGLGRALTKLVAEKMGQERQEELPSLIWTTLILMLILGFIGTVVFASFSPFLVVRIFKVPSYIQVETLHTFYLLAAALPIVISATGLKGVLEAKQRFDLTNAIRIPLGVFTFLSPLFVLPFTRDLFWVTALLVLGRCASWGVHFALCLRVIPSLSDHKLPCASYVKPLLKFGGWLTVSNLVSPLMVYLDRFLIGALVSVSAVAYYSAPWEVITKLLVIPGAIVGVLFPVFSYSYVNNSDRSVQLYHRGLKYVFIILFPMILVFVTFAEEGLQVWLGPSFAENGFRAAQWLAIGVLLNGLASIPFAFIQGAGRPDITARLHLIEAVFYVPYAWWLISGYGIVGAAVAWASRVGVDAILLLFFASRYFVRQSIRWNRSALWLLVAGLVLITGMQSLPIVFKVAFFATAFLCFILISWFIFMDNDERFQLQSKMGQLFRYVATR